MDQKPTLRERIAEIDRRINVAREIIEDEQILINQLLLAREDLVAQMTRRGTAAIWRRSKPSA